MLLCQHTFPILRTTQWGKNSLQRWPHRVSCPYPEWPSHIYSKALPENQLFKHLKKFFSKCVCTKPDCRRLGNLVGRSYSSGLSQDNDCFIHFSSFLVYVSINNTWHLKMNVSNVLKFIPSGFYFYYNFIIIMCVHIHLCASECRCLKRPEAVVEPPNMGAGNWSPL